MTRSTEEVFNSHREAVETLDLEKLIGDYAEDAILVTLDGAYIGREEIMTGFFQTILAQFPDVKISFDKVAFEDNVCLLQWSAEASAAMFPVATTVFIIENGLIQRQGEWFQMVPKEG
ncbi:MAG TPA: nuclear transport factor 2 family protein [Anaerolineae bacterium]|jgi:ketosteroid isomerase-like protein|nr:nuclear transport factor 2 family protein [Anaerolineae bacterium]